MARIRTIKPEFPQSESMGRVSRDARLLFVQLWTICDDAGRTRAASRMLASLLFPYDNDAPTLIDGWLEELEREECIIRYRVEGSSYLQICNWLNHQRIDRPSKSNIPSFDESSRIISNPREDSTLDKDLDQGPRTKDLDQVCDAPTASASSDKPKTAETWIAYRDAYVTRYGTAPLRNATVNGVISKFVDRIGITVAPEVAAHYVRSDAAYYVQRGHSVQAMLADCEKLHMEWKTGRKGNGTNQTRERVDNSAVARVRRANGVEDAPRTIEAERIE